MSIERNYRPRQFRDFKGQDMPVRQVTALIKPALRGLEKINQPLLLFGPVGLGKTSMAEVFEAAMNCTQNELDGSPCLQCAMCLAHDTHQNRFCRYVVPTHGGDKESILPFIGDLSTEVPAGYRMLFFDEAHALTPRAAEALLGAIDQRPKGVIFCFATTAPETLIPSLLSRLTKVEFRPLGPVTAIDFLKEICDSKNIRADPEALALLAGLSRGRARDLLNMLQQVWQSHPTELIDVLAVETCLGISFKTGLSRYVLALADGDLARQVKALRMWEGDVEDLCRYVRSFLTAVYYNNLHGETLVVDGLIHSMQAERYAFLSRLRARLGVDSDVDMIPPFSALLDRLSLLPNAKDVTESHSHLRLLQTHINALTLALRSTPISWEPVSEKSQVGLSRDLTDVQGIECEPWEGREHFLVPPDATAMFERASFFTQISGRSLNTFLQFRLHAATQEDARVASTLVLNSMVDMVTGTGRDRSNEIAFVALIERRNTTFDLLVSMYIPRICRDVVTNWDHALNHKSDLTHFDFCDRSGTMDGMHYQWECIKRLCAGLSPELGDHEKRLRLAKPFRSLLQLSPDPVNNLSLNGISGGFYTTSSNIGMHAIDRAVEQKQAPLFALRDKAFTFIYEGWELQEHQVRCAILAKRRAELAQLQAIFGRENESLDQKWQALMADWPVDTFTWPRPWKTWWS